MLDSFKHTKLWQNIDPGVQATAAIASQSMPAAASQLSVAYVQWTAVTTLARTPFRVHTVRTCFNRLSRCLLHVAWLVPNSTIRTPATDMLYNTTNGEAHNNGQKFATSQHLDMSRCGIFVVQQVVELLRACLLVVLYNMSVAGVRVVEFGT